MSHINQLPINLAQLQNLTKRDPDAYQEEFLQQYRRYESNMQVFLLQPNENSKVLSELVMFIAQVSMCYPDIVKKFPFQLQDILKTHCAVLHPDVRMTLCRAMMLLRKKELVPAMTVYQLFLDLFRCQDKSLRQFLSKYIINDIRNINKRQKNNSVNKALQNHMYSRLAENHATAVKMSLIVLTTLYQRKIWNDAKTVNVVSTACFSKYPKVIAIALRFFLGGDRELVDDSDDENHGKQLTAKDIIKRYQTHKKNTRAKMKRKKDMKKLRKQKKKEGANKKNKGKRNIDFSAIHLLNDPDGFADRLYQKLQKSTNTFEIRLMMIMVISRVVGVHKLFLFNLYPFLQRFLQPHQKEVTKILLSLAQASHELIPPDILRDCIMTIANNFVTERNSSEVMAVGLNTIREICVRCPLAMTEELLKDLTEYQRKQEKPVTAAARSLVMLFRKANPKYLHKRDRGRLTEASKDLVVTRYGEVVTKDYIPGSDILPDVPEASTNPNIDGWESFSEDSDSDSDGSWCNVSSDEDTRALIAAEKEKINQKRSKKKKGKSKMEREKEKNDSEAIQESNLNDEEKVAKSQILSQTRIFAPADFNLINAHQESKAVTLTSRKKGNLKRKHIEIETGENTEGGEILSLGKIEYVNMKKPRDKESRMAAALAAKEDRLERRKEIKKCDPFASTTNKRKLKMKPFMMVKPKLQQKQRRSFQEKQKALKTALLKRAKKYKFACR